jgi:uncharacterized membrane protein
MTRSLLAVAALVLFGCEQEETADPEGEPASVDSGVCGESLPEMTWQSFGNGFVSTYCQGCHASGTFDRHGAPESVVFDSEDDVLSRADAMTRTTLSEAPTMPPGGGIPTEQRELLAAYLKCAGP